MKLLDERNQVKYAIAGWIKNYGMERTYPVDKRRRLVGKELSELDEETATADQVNEIIGNSAWVRKLLCDECGKETWDLVQIGAPEDYDSATAEVCADCLTKALNLLSKK